MKRIYTLLFTCLLFFISSPVMADQEERFYDLFSGMLEQRDGHLVFTRCGYKSDPMQVKFVDEPEKLLLSEIDSKIKNHPLVQVRVTADVVKNEEDAQYPYSIFVKEFITFHTGESCHLDDYLNALPGNVDGSNKGGH